MKKSKLSQISDQISEVNKSSSVLISHNSGCEFFNSSQLEKVFYESLDIEQAPGVMPSAFYEDTLSNRARSVWFNFRHNSKTAFCLTTFLIILNLITIIGTLLIIYIYKPSIEEEKANGKTLWTVFLIEAIGVVSILVATLMAFVNSELSIKCYNIKALAYLITFVINTVASVFIIIQSESSYSLFSIALLVSALCFLLLAFDTIVMIIEIKKSTKNLPLEAD